jgi:putative membrane protein
MAIGIANAIPGVSGGTIAFILGIYDKMMDAIGNFFLELKSDKTKGRFIFLIFLIIGIAIGGWGFSRILNFLLQTEYKQPVYFLFGGLIAGSLPFVFKVQKDMKATFPRITALVIGIAIVVAMTVFRGAAPEVKPHAAPMQTNNAVISNTAIDQLAVASTNIAPPVVSNAAQTHLVDFTPPRTWDYLLWIGICGFFAASAMVVPGVSGSALLIVFGEYYHVINMVARVSTNFTDVILPLGVFGVGMVLGVIVAAKVIDFFLKRYPSGTMYFIIGLMLASFYQIWMQLQAGFTFNALIFSLSIGAFIGGFALAYFMSRIPVEPKTAEKMK